MHWPRSRIRPSFGDFVWEDIMATLRLKKKVLKKFEEFYHFVLFSRSFGIILWVMEVATVSTVSVLEVIPLIFWVTKMCCWQGKFGNVYNQAVQVISGLMVIAMMSFWIFLAAKGISSFLCVGNCWSLCDRKRKKKKRKKKPSRNRPTFVHLIASALWPPCRF